MTGMGYMIMGIVVVTLSTIGFIIGEILLFRQKKRMKESAYQIYS